MGVGCPLAAYQNRPAPAPQALSATSLVTESTLFVESGPPVQARTHWILPAGSPLPPQLSRSCWGSELRPSGLCSQHLTPVSGLFCFVFSIIFYAGNGNQGLWSRGSILPLSHTCDVPGGVPRRPRVLVSFQTNHPHGVILKDLTHFSSELFFMLMICRCSCVFWIKSGFFSHCICLFICLCDRASLSPRLVLNLL